MEPLICDQGVGHISEGVLNGLFVGDQRLLVLRFGQTQFPPDPLDLDTLLAVSIEVADALTPKVLSSATSNPQTSLSRSLVASRIVETPGGS